jgi:hypothetical protein
VLRERRFKRRTLRGRGGLGYQHVKDEEEEEAEDMDND